MSVGKGRTGRISASSKVAESLRKAILSGELKPGDRTQPEVELGRIHGVSRVTVRAAIHQLKGEGLLESRQGGGTFVRLAAPGLLGNAIPAGQGEQPDRIDMFEFRRIMEVESVGLAALRANAEMVSRMDETVARMRDATLPDDIAHWDLAFHRLVAEASDNTYIRQVFELLKGSYLQMLTQNARIMGSNGAHFHALICRAIEIRDDEMAKAYMREHLTDTIRSTMNRMREQALEEAGSQP